MWLVESDRFSLTVEKSSLAARPAMAACVNTAFILGVGVARKSQEEDLKEREKDKIQRVLFLVYLWTNEMKRERERERERNDSEDVK